MARKKQTVLYWSTQSSVDPLIQEPGNSQSINPYSYIMNNPLWGTDPSGYASQMTTACSYNGNNGFNRCQFSLEMGGNNLNAAAGRLGSMYNWSFQSNENSSNNGAENQTSYVSMTFYFVETGGLDSINTDTSSHDIEVVTVSGKPDRETLLERIERTWDRDHPQMLRTAKKKFPYELAVFEVYASLYPTYLWTDGDTRLQQEAEAMLGFEPFYVALASGHWQTLNNLLGDINSELKGKIFSEIQVKIAKRLGFKVPLIKGIQDVISVSEMGKKGDAFADRFRVKRKREAGFLNRKFVLDFYYGAYDPELDPNVQK